MEKITKFVIIFEVFHCEENDTANTKYFFRTGLLNIELI